MARLEFTPTEVQQSELIARFLAEAGSAAIFLRAVASNKHQTWEVIMANENIKKHHIHFMVMCEATRRIVENTTTRVLNKHREHISYIIAAKMWYGWWVELLVIRRGVEVKEMEERKKMEQSSMASRAIQPVTNQCKGTAKDEDEIEEGKLAASWAAYWAHVEEENGKLTRKQRKQKKKKERREFYSSFASLAPYFHKVHKDSKKENLEAALN